MTLSSRLLAAFITCAGATAAQAHEGHGLEAFSHWHATDAAGFIAVLAVAVGLFWWHGRK